MTDRPILMSSPMVRALLDGSKTQTRRLAWRSILDEVTPEGEEVCVIHKPTIWQSVKPGDWLWVRETWAPLNRLMHDDPGAAACASGGFYRADNSTVEGEIQFWSPSIHMPRRASRLTLVVTATKMERVQEINGLEALAEGVDREEGTAPWRMFCRLWKRLHTKPGARWEDNPEVVALTFSVHQQNIDAMGKAA